MMKKPALIVLLGKSGSGKDTVLTHLLTKVKQDKITLDIARLVTHTTRPQRPGEQNGVDYWYHTNDEFQKMKDAGQVLEFRSYPVAGGPWYYWTAAEPLTHDATITISTLDGLHALQTYYGEKANIFAFYVDTAYGRRMKRAISREGKAPNYEEICRRFIADEADFSEEKLLAA